MNSTFRACWLSKLGGDWPCTIQLRAAKENKMASHFASVSEEEILSMKQEAVPKNTKMATKFGVTVFHGKLLISPIF